MRSTFASSIMAVLAASLAVPAAAQVNFSQVSITQPLTVAEIQTALSVSNTFTIDGVALGPGDDIFIVHRDTSALETIAQIDPFTKAVAFTKSVAQLKSDLGGVYNSTATFPILVGEFVYDPTANALFIADQSTGLEDYAVIRVPVGASPATAVIRNNTTVAGWNSHGVLSTGTLVAALGEDHELITGGEPAVGIIDPDAGTPAFTEIFDMDDFLAAASLTGELPPEAVAVNPTNDDVIVFAHDQNRIFRIQNIEGGSPTLTALNIPGWNGVVDLHGLAVDEDGNIYGFDEAAESIVIYNGTSTFEVTFDDIATALGQNPATTPFEATLWRGIKARKISANQSELYIASNNADYGVVRVVFGGASVNDWQLMD